MKKPKKVIIVFLIILILNVTVFLGATIYWGNTTISISYQGKTVFTKEYKVKTSTAFAVLIKYGGSYEKFYNANSDNEIVMNYSCLNDGIAGDLNSVVAGIEKPCAESVLEWNAGTAEFQYIDGKNGLSVDQNHITGSLYKSFGKTVNINIKTTEIKPFITVDTLKQRSAERGYFSTGYASSSTNRMHNIELAVKKINGTRIPAGEELSFNKIVGERTEEKGFVIAKIIQDGKFIEGVGGGVCQVSTTLYNAWVRANLKVLNAVNHSLPVSYVSPSLDAMVSSRNDLLLYNNSPYDVYIKAETKQNKIYMTVYGLYENEKIELRNEIVKTIPCNDYEEVDEEISWVDGEIFRILALPKDGLVSYGYKDIYVGGKLIRTEKFRTNTYQPQKGKIVRRKKEENKKLYYEFFFRQELN